MKAKTQMNEKKNHTISSKASTIFIPKSHKAIERGGRSQRECWRFPARFFGLPCEQPQEQACQQREEAPFHITHQRAHIRVQHRLPETGLKLLEPRETGYLPSLSCCIPRPHNEGQEQSYPVLRAVALPCSLDRAHLTTLEITFFN